MHREMIYQPKIVTHVPACGVVQLAVQIMTVSILIQLVCILTPLNTFELLDDYIIF